MDEARFRYRCRQCGARFTQGATAATRAECAMAGALAGQHDVTRIPLLMTVHLCPGGGAGVADLVGYIVCDDAADGG